MEDIIRKKLIINNNITNLFLIIKCFIIRELELKLLLELLIIKIIIIKL